MQKSKVAGRNALEMNLRLDNGGLRHSAMHFQTTGAAKTVD